MSTTGLEVFDPTPQDPNISAGAIGRNNRPRQAVAMNSAMTKRQDRAGSGDWWVADEEPEIYPAERVRPNRIMLKSTLQRVMVAIGLGVAVGVSGILFF